MTRLDYTREKYLWIMKRGFVEKTIVDEQLSEAETSSSACGWYKARLLRIDKKKSAIFSTLLWIKGISLEHGLKETR